MVSCGLVTNPKCRRDLFVGEPPADEPQHFSLACTESVDRQVFGLLAKRPCKQKGT